MDIEKTIQFLLEQQARFDAHQAELATHQAEFAAHQTELVAHQASHQARFEKDVIQINDILIRVSAAQERTSEILATLTERHVELAKSHQETEQNLNALISTVERHITNHN